MREIKEKTTVYINGKHGRRKAQVTKVMSVREAKKQKLYDGARSSGTFLLLRMEDDGSTVGRHKSLVYMQPKQKQVK